MNDNPSLPPTGPFHRQEQFSDLVRRLAEAEAALRAVTADQVDAVIDPVSATPILLRQARESLSESEARYRRLLSRMSAIVFELNADGTTLFVNEAIYAATGFQPDEVLGQNWWDIFCPGAQRTQVDLLYDQLRAGDVTNYELVVRAKDGTLITLDLNSANRYDNDGSLNAILGFGIDVTARKEAERALRESEARYRVTSTLTSDYVYALRVLPDKTFAIEWITDSFARITGYTFAEFKQRGDWPTLIHSEDLPMVYRRAQAILNGETNVGEFRIITRSGQVRWVRDYAQPTWDANHERVVHVLGAVQDITERKLAEEALQQSQARFAGIVNVAEDAIISVDTNQHITFFNQGAERIFGYMCHEVIGRPLDILLPERFAGAHQRHVAAFAQAAHAARRMGERRELFGRRKDGSEFPLEASIAQFTVGDEQVLAVVLHDVTDHKQAQAALHKANAQLIASVAELEQRNREMTALSEMGDILQICASMEEAYAVVARFARRLFPDESGALSILRSSANLVESVVVWGDSSATDKRFAPDECWALRRGRVHLVDDFTSDIPCAHVLAPVTTSICVPMMAQGESLGVLHIQYIAADAEQPSAAHQRITESKQRLAMAMAEHIALALSNLKLRETLRNQAIRDPLTGLYNRRYMEESLERELRRASRSRYPIGVIMLDIDNFKHFNDTFGHDAGDLLLCSVGAFLQSSIRAEDIACRYGGEEFALIMPEASEKVTQLRAETIREGVKRLNVEYLNRTLGPITISAGVAIVPNHSAGVASALRRADAALYRAKNEGRDRVVVERPRIAEETFPA